MINSTLYQSGSPDLVVKGEDSYQKAMSSNPSIEWMFITLMCCKNCFVCLEIPISLQSTKSLEMAYPNYCSVRSQLHFLLDRKSLSVAGINPGANQPPPIFY